jgi:hypothetical protein
MLYIGGDSAGVSGLDVISRKDSKVFNVGEMIFGYTSSFRMGQLLRFSFNPPKHEDGLDTYEYMCTVFIDKIRKTLKKGGYTKINFNEEEGGVFLVGYRKRLFLIHSDFQVGESIDDYHSIGCGDKYALGALSILCKNTGVSTHLTAEYIITESLSAAAKFSGGVEGPFNIIKL